MDIHCQYFMTNFDMCVCVCIQSLKVMYVHILIQGLKFYHFLLSFFYELSITSKFCHCFVVVLLFCHSFAKEDFNAFKHLNTQGCEVFLGFRFVFTSYILHFIKVRISKFLLHQSFIKKCFLHNIVANQMLLQYVKINFVLFHQKFLTKCQGDLCCNSLEFCYSLS